MNSYKTEIEKVVSRYHLAHAGEFRIFQKALTDKRDLQANQYASLKGDHALYRILFEIPETLDLELKLLLTDEAWSWLFDNPKSTGARWFARRFPEFRVAQKL